MIHNSGINELSASYVLPTAAVPLQNKSPLRLETLHFQTQTSAPCEKELPPVFTGGTRSVWCSITAKDWKWSARAQSGGRPAADRRHWARFCSSDGIFTPTKLPSAKSWAAATKQAVKWVKKQNNNKNHSSLWRRVNKRSVGGSHRPQEPEFSFQSAES